METIKSKDTLQSVKEGDNISSGSKNYTEGIANNKENENEEIIRRTEINETPFTIVTTEGKMFGVMGKYRLTEVYDVEDIKDAKDLEDIEKVLEEELTKITWNRLVQVMILITGNENLINKFEPINKEEA